jgi:hypothetical protein
MSEQSLDNILKQVIDTLEEDIREALNQKTTVATFSATIIERAFLKQLDFIYADKNRKDKNGNIIITKGEAKFPAWYALTENDKNSVKTFIKEESKKLLKDIYNQYSNYNPSGLYVDISQLQRNRFTVTISRLLDTNGKPIGELEKRSGFRGEYEINSFTAVREGYSRKVKELWDLIAKKILNKDELDQNRDAKWLQGAIDLEHTVGASVAEQRVGRAIDLLASSIGSEGVGGEAVLEALGLKTYIKYLARKGKTSINVVVGPASANKSKGSKKEKKIISNLTKKIQKSLKRKILKNKQQVFKDWKGSDYRYTIEKKKIVESFVKSLKKNKQIKIKSIDTKLNLSNRISKTETTKGKKPTVKKAKVDFNPLVQKLNVKNNVKSQKSTINLGALKAQINARLSMTVIKNMGTPALNNQTGRFARSAIVTDVVQTSQGFPSIGYTYQKYPYQTFEPGYKQGSVDRDPRTLIDRSIREIAQQLIVGRFYTRRV